MKSIRAQQSPQRRPWPPTRVRQTIHTGGKRSASEVSMAHTAEPAVNPAAGTSAVRSASVVAMAGMIKRDGAMIKRGGALAEEETCAGA